MNKLGMMLAAMLLAVTSMARASVTNWGVVGPAQTVSATVAPGEFLNIYEFIIPTESELGAVTVSANIPSYFDISDGMVDLFSGMFGSSSTLLGGYGFSGTSGNTVHIADLSAGSYFFAVSGDADGAFGGTYLLNAATSCVPEPESYALMLGGLSILVGLSRWRKTA